jgi:hypothetical protein
VAGDERRGGVGFDAFDVEFVDDGGVGIAGNGKGGVAEGFSPSAAKQASRCHQGRHEAVARRLAELLGVYQ